MQINPSDTDCRQRRHIIKTLGVTGLTAVAGCLGGDSSDSASGQDTTQNEEASDTGSQETEQESEPEDFDTPESEHMDTETLVENWGTTYSDHKRVGLGSFSPSQLSEKLDENWGYGVPYESLPFSQDDVPETIKQETPHEHASNFVKVDQLPSGASVDDVKSSLEEEGYELQEEVGDFSIYTTVDEREARAVGDGVHIMAYNLANEGPSSNVHREHLNELLETQQSDTSNLDEEVQDLLDTIDVRDSFTAYKDQDFYTDFVGGIGGDQPVAGAVTVDVEEGAKYAAWKFENEEAAQQAYETKSGRNGDLSNGFTQVDQEGQYLTAAGGFGSEQAFESTWRVLEAPVI